MPKVKTPIQPSIFDFLGLASPISMLDAPAVFAKPFFSMKEIVKNNQKLPGVMKGARNPVNVERTPSLVASLADSYPAANTITSAWNSLLNYVTGPEGLNVPTDAFTSAQWRREQLLKLLQGGK